MGARRPRRPAWDPLHAMTLGRPLPAVVQVRNNVAVPAGGMLTFYARGFGATGRLRVHIGGVGGDPLASFDLDGTGGQLADARVPIPPDTEPGPHVLTFVAGDREFDLLVKVTATRARATLDRATVRPGEDLGFTVVGLGRRTVGHVKLDSEGTPVPFAIDADGAGGGRFTVPADTPPGPHHLRFLAPDPPTSLLEHFEVEAPG